MNDTEKNQRKLSIYTSLLLIVVLLVGVSYALFQIFARQSGQNNISTIDCLSVTYEDVSAALSLVNEFPITDNEGYQKSPYTFKVTNNCSEYVGLEVGVETLTTSTVKPQYIKGSINRVGIDPTTAMILSTGKVGEAMNGGTNYIIKKDGLAANESVNYELRLWIDYDTTEAQAGKEWHGKVVVSAVAETAPATWDDPGEGTLMAELKANNEISTPVSVPGREPSAHTIDDVTDVNKTYVTTNTGNYYITYGTGWTANGSKFNLTGTTITSSVYSTSYSNLVGKYLPGSSLSVSGYPKTTTSADNVCIRYGTNARCSSNSYCMWTGNRCRGKTGATVTTIRARSTVSLDAIYYVVDATSSSLTVKELTSNKTVAEKNIASTQDDYGTSYYFRGKVDNNFVQYANMCWRIVRITGNGAIKMVLYNYNGLTDSNNTPTYNNPCNVIGSHLSFARYEGDTYKSTFNDNSDDNANIGFMYGTTGANSYSETHANTNTSSVLTNLNKWYTNVLSKQDGFSEKQLADVIWCNDKSTIKALVNENLYGTGLGYGSNHTGYGAYSRIGDTASYARQYASPSLVCSNDNNGGKLSKFTVDDLEYGNGALKGYAKIGLLTVDEAAFAGAMFGVNNSTCYLNQNATYLWWLLSPYSFDDNALMFSFNAYGQIRNSNVTSTNTLRPVIALVPNVEIVSGDGTAANPYKIGM
ncbi:MAG: hypothetical protein Q4C44_01265 [bacterium]|nr:hypothetical protein [bacterium]